MKNIDELSQVYIRVNRMIESQVFEQVKNQASSLVRGQVWNRILSMSLDYEQVVSIVIDQIENQLEDKKVIKP
jgi:hypothetical protein